MDFYYFGGKFEQNQAEVLENSGFVSVLFTYNPLQGDFFTKVARNIDLNAKIKYMIAVRAHTLSPQYLCMINQAMNDIMPNRLQINLISGHIKENEKSFGGLIGDVTDLSTRIERSNYLIEYLKELNEMSKNKDVQIPDLYVTTTNKYVFEVATGFDNKMIIHYKDYCRGHWLEYIGDQSHQGDSFSIKDKKVMIVVCPVLRETQQDIDDEFPIQDMVNGGGEIVRGRPNMMSDDQYFTYEEFKRFIKKIESEGINEIMLHGTSEQERKRIIEFVNDYKKIDF